MKHQPTGPRAVPESVLRMPVQGRHLAPGTLGDQLSDRTLLVFLRHLG